MGAKGGGGPPPMLMKWIDKLRHGVMTVGERMAPPHFALLHMVTGRWRAVAIEAIAEIDVASHLRDGDLPIAELARRTEMHEESLYRVMRALAREGVFVEEPKRVFGLTSLSRPLLEDDPNSVRNVIRNYATEREERVWTASSLISSLKTGEPAHEEVFDMDLWTRFERHPEEAEIFHRAMVELTRQVAPLIAEAYDFGRHRSLVDVGGGRGALLSAILKAHPGLEGVCFDTEQALEGAEATLEAHGVRKRAELVVGNMLKAVPEGHDAYLLKHVVHGFDDRGLVGILGAIREAMGPDGRLILVEHLVPDRGPYMQFLDLQMLLASFRGKERTVAQFRSLLDQHGFTLERVEDTASPVSILVARRS